MNTLSLQGGGIFNTTTAIPFHHNPFPVRVKQLQAQELSRLPIGLTGDHFPVQADQAQHSKRSTVPDQDHQLLFHDVIGAMHIPADKKPGQRHLPILKNESQKAICHNETRMKLATKDNSICSRSIGGSQSNPPCKVKFQVKLQNNSAEQTFCATQLIVTILGVISNKFICMNRNNKIRLLDPIDAEKEEGCYWHQMNCSRINGILFANYKYYDFKNGTRNKRTKLVTNGRVRKKTSRNKRNQHIFRFGGTNQSDSELIESPNILGFRKKKGTGRYEAATGKRVWRSLSKTHRHNRRKTPLKIVTLFEMLNYNKYQNDHCSNLVNQTHKIRHWSTTPVGATGKPSPSSSSEWKGPLHLPKTPHRPRRRRRNLRRKLKSRSNKKGLLG